MDNNEKQIELDLSSLSKTRVVVKDNPNAELYLDLSDMNVIVRLEEKYPELNQLEEEASKYLSKQNSSVEDTIANTAKMLKEIDVKMREVMDYIFEANVSEVCAPSGNMFDFIKGKARYEHIFEAIVQLYGNNISQEAKKLEKRFNNTHTAKYVKH